MDYLLIACFTICVSVVAYFILFRKKYRPTQSLFTEAERKFLFVLDEAVGNKCRVFAKVRVADLVEVNGISSNNKKAFYSAFSKIGMKHIDYILVDKITLKVQVLVELDDRSHLLGPRIQRDKFLDDLFASVKLPLVRINVSRKYSISDIQKALQPYINVQAQQPNPVPTSVATLSRPDSANAYNSPAPVQSPHCLKCGSPQVLRSEPNSTKQYWACPSFPPCS